MMRHNTKYILLASVLALVTATGCQREDFASTCDGILKFSVGFAGSNEIVLSKGATLTSEDGTVSIPLSCTVTDGIEVNLPETKSTQINSEADFLDEGLTSFTVAGWNADKTEFVPSGTAVKDSDGRWKTDATYRWRGSEAKTFLAYANLPSSGATVTNYVTPSVKQTFTYTVPTDARQQNDIMLGWYEGNGGGTATAAITMVHPLTAVVFKTGEIDASVTAIKSISISGVYVSGTADVTYALSDGDVVPTYNWGSSRTGSQTVTLSPAGEATELEVASDGKIGTSFIILPQTVAAGTLTLKITVVKDGADAVLAASVPAGTWQEGKTNTFTIGYIGQYVDLGLSVKWGNFNLGASKREEYGEYYSWAGLDNVASTSINLDFSHCPYHTGSGQNTGWTKYNSLSGHGTVDNKTILDLDDDVAHVKKQDPWHMPTEAQWQELIDNCTWEWVDDFNGTGVAGMKVTSRIAGYTDRYIFLPAAGYRTGNILNSVGTICDYWYPQMKADNTYSAYYIYITKDKIQNYDNNRYTGRTVRPVYDDTPKTITAIPASGCESMGTVTGSGSYLFGETATLSATPIGDYVFSKWNDGVTTATRTITVTAAATYEAIFETNPVLPGIFSISATEYIQFSKGNLFCTDKGSGNYEFSFEENQFDFRCRNGWDNDQAMINGSPTTTPASTSGQFQWLTANSGAGENDLACYGAFSELTQDGARGLASDQLNYGLSMGSENGWYTLSESEYAYLINSRPNATKLRKWCTVCEVNGLLLAPDVESSLSAVPDYLTDYTTKEAWKVAAETYGLVFLPATGYLCMHDDGDLGDHRGVNGVGSVGYYYSSSSNPFEEEFQYLAYYLGFNDTGAETGNFNRNYARSVRLVKKFDKPEVTPAFIDLDLPSGTLWADVNVGATSKTGTGSYGKFYAWGETETKATFTIDNYEFTSAFNRYNGTDGLTRLLSADDVAASKVSGSHIPTRLQFEELLNNAYTTYSWKDDYNGVPGLLITSKSNDNSVFLPAAGLQNEYGPALIGNNGCYWSSTLNPTPASETGTAFPACAIDLDFVRDNTTPPFIYQENDNSRRLAGQSVRAVKQGQKTIEYVEIGGLKWATCNLGANTPKDYGWYFSWGGTTGYVHDGSKWVTAQGGSELSGGFSYANAQYNTGGVNTSWNKYIPTGKGMYWSGGGSPDNKLSLDPEDDAVRANLGGSWRMPTQADFQTLYEACGGTNPSSGIKPTPLSSSDPGKGIYWVSNTQTYISDYDGVAGILFCDGASKLFFVAAGYGTSTSFCGDGTEGRYWSGTVNSTIPSYAYRLGFQFGNVCPANVNERYQGFPVRPVSD